MKNIFIIIFVLFLCASCGKNRAVINVQLENANEKELVLSQLLVNKIVVVDTLKTDKSGNVKYKLEMPDESPNFYYLSYNRKRLASLIIIPKDKISVKCDTLGNNLQINGSEESLLLKKIDDEFVSTINSFDSLSFILVNNSNMDDESKVKIKKDLGALYVKQKRSALKSIMEHPYSLTNITLLYQKFNENFPIFADINDGLIFKRVYDSLKVSYPSSMYLKSLEVDIQNFDKSRMLQDKFSQVSEISFPNVLGYDINSKKRELYELSGKPFILVFWTSTQVAQKMFNLDLLDIYNKYHSAGLEIYQISVDTDKVQWATTIKDQKLPWINVCDGSGNASPAIASYNISKLPSLFLFDREGNMKGKDIFDKSKLESVVSSIVK